MAGGWCDEIGTIKKCRAEFIKSPCRHHLRPGKHASKSTPCCRWIDQVEQLIVLKNENPSVRIRSSDQLGPTTVVQVEQRTENTLKGPASYVVLPEIFAEHLKRTPTPEMMVSEVIDGAPKMVAPGRAVYGRVGVSIIRPDRQALSMYCIYIIILTLLT